MATTLSTRFMLVIDCFLIYGILTIVASDDTHGVTSSDSHVPDTLCDNIEDQIQVIANKAAEDILQRLNNKIQKDLTENTVQEIVSQKIQGVIIDVNTQTATLTNNLKTEIDNSISSKEVEILNKTKTEMNKISNDCQTEYSGFRDLINSKMDDESRNIKEKITNDIKSIKTDLEKDLYNISQYTPPVTHPQGAIAFTALLSRNFDNTDSYVLFDRILTNLGLGYNAITGIFTAPTNGSYVFTASFLVNGGYVNIKLLKNNVEVVRGYGARGVVEGSGFVYTILQLAKDDQIGLKPIPGWSTGHLRGDMYSSFSGFLVGK